MIKILFIMVALSFAGQPATGQATEGVILYEFRMDVHRQIPPEQEGMKAMIPQFRTENFELLFTPDRRFYRRYVDINELAARGGRRPFVASRMEVYVNTKSQEWVTFHEFMGRRHLIVDSLSIAPWRLGHEYMEIAGYRCQMAYFTDTLTNEVITAWFTLALQPFIGPDRFVTLPGAILALDINNGERVWVARRIEIKDIDDEEITKPTRGERITRSEYQKVIEEQMERMRSSPGGFRF